MAAMAGLPAKYIKEAFKQLNATGTTKLANASRAARRHGAERVFRLTGERAISPWSARAAFTLAIALAVIVSPVGLGVGQWTVLPVASAGSPDGQTEGEGVADSEVWTIDRFVDAVVERSDTVVKAKEALRTAQLNAGLAKPINSLSVSAAGTWRNQVDRTSGLKDSQTLSVRIPLTDKISLSGDYTVNDGSGKVGISYSPFAGATLSEIRSDFLGAAVGSIGPSEEALDAVKKAELALVEAYATARLNARKTYIDALKTIKSREAAEEEYRLAEIRYEIAKRRYELGLAPESDVESAESALLDAEISLMRARNEEEWLRRSLSEMTGRAMSDAEFADLPEFSQPIPEVEDLVASAMAVNSQLMQAKKDVESARKALESARSLLPQFKLDVSAGNKESKTASDGGNGGSPSITFTASWSISLSRQYEIDKAALALEQRERALEDVRKSLAEEIEKSVSDLKIEVYSMRKWKSQLEAAEESYRKALESYEKGETLLVDVDAAALNLKKTRDSYMNSWGSVWSLWYSLVAKCHLEQ